MMGMLTIRIVLQLVMVPLATFGAYVLWDTIPPEYLIIQIAGGIGFIVILYNMYKDTFIMMKEFKAGIDES